MDFRPIVGLTEADRGTVWERVLVGTILGAAIEQHNRDMERIKKGR
jgi:hypothetical protein